MQISLSSYSFSSVQLKYRYSLSSGYNSSIKCYQILILLNLSLYFFFLNVTYMYPIHPLISDNDEATLQQTDGHLFRFSIYFFNRPIKFRIDEQIVIFKIVFFFWYWAMFLIIKLYLTVYSLNTADIFNSDFLMMIWF